MGRSGGGERSTARRVCPLELTYLDKDIRLDVDINSVA
jgi:hypothetical protein